MPQLNKLEFQANKTPSLGVEVELALVNGESMALSSSIHDVLAKVPSQFTEAIKPELMQCYLEINSDVCQSVAEAEADLREKICLLEGITDDLNLRLLWAGTHPFSLWRDQEIVQTERYKMLLNLLQDTARQLITFGFHVHVGVDSGDKAIMICERIMQHLPVLLALSCNSPCWENRVTGLQSSRSKIMESLPTAGLPPLMRNWSEYTWLINHLVETGFINTIREIWWDVRPHHNFGTVEIRICDIPPSLDDAMALVALIQCLVKALSDEIDEGTYQYDFHPMLVRQNKWHACRYGLDARLVDGHTLQARTIKELTENLVSALQPTAQELHCESYLERVLALADGPSGAQRQLQLLEETSSPVETLHRLTAKSRLTK